MRTSGVETWRAKIMYAAVYHFGPRWPRQVEVLNLRVTQTPVAKERALTGAKLGSTAEIVGVRPRGRTFIEILTNQPETGDFDIRVLPPPPRLKDSDFERLKQTITALEPSELGGLSLEEIRNYQPEW